MKNHSGLEIGGLEFQEFCILKFFPEKFNIKRDNRGGEMGENGVEIEMMDAKSSPWSSDVNRSHLNGITIAAVI